MEEELNKLKADYKKLMIKHNKELSKYKQSELKILKYEGLIFGLIIGIVANILIALFS